VAGNVLLWGALLSLVWRELAGRASSWWWWSTLVASAVFAPAISTIFWLQVNLIAFALALAGAYVVGRHGRLAAVLIGISIALKPITILVPMAFLLRRESRSAGALSIVVGVALNFLGFVFLAWRAHDAALLNPVAYAIAFLFHGQGPTIVCVTENYSPVALMCRLGLRPQPVVNIVVVLLVLAALSLSARRLSNSPAWLWELFAVACALSPMVGPIGWAHYQLLLGPLMLLLAYQFWQGRAPLWLWLGLGVSFAAAEMVWDPLESLAGVPLWLIVFSYSLGQFSQYFLLLTWSRWLYLRGEPAPLVGALPLSTPPSGP
jgi:hypothetical protein